MRGHIRSPASLDEASIARVTRMADRIIPGHFPELKREGNLFTPVSPQSLEIQFK